MKTLPAWQTLSIWQVAAAYVGTVVGAGFASGQEILQFFGAYGLRGVYGLMLAVFLLAGYGEAAMLVGHAVGAQSYRDVTAAAAGPWLGRLLDALIAFFLFGGLAAMVAGSGAVFREQFHLPSIWGTLAMAAAATATVWAGMHGVVTALTSFAPLLVAGALTVAALTLLREPVSWQWAQPELAALPWWPVAAVAYASYNLILALSVLAPLGAMASPAVLRRGAVLGATGLGVGALAILLTLLALPESTRLEVPMLAAAGAVAPSLRTAYTVVLLGEVYTTAVSSLFGFTSRLVSAKSPAFRWVAALTALGALLAGQVGFARLVGTLYVGVGIAGVLLLAALTRARWSGALAGDPNGPASHQE